MKEHSARSIAGKGLGIAGLVVGIVALVISFIPCIGMFALIPGTIAVILSTVGVITATQKDGAKSMTISALVVSLIACGIAAWQTNTIIKVAKEANIAITETNYHSCDELILAYENAVDEFVVRQQELQDQEKSFAVMNTFGGAVALITKITNIQLQSIDMKCAENENYQLRLQKIDQKYKEVQTEK